MLNDFLEMFLGAFHEYVSADCPHREYFDCVLCVGVLITLCAGCMALVITLVSGGFKAIRGAFK